MCVPPSGESAMDAAEPGSAGLLRSLGVGSAAMWNSGGGPAWQAGLVGAGRRGDATGPPSGTVTFLFTDVVGSTPLWDRFPELMEEVLAVHDRLIERAVSEHGGHVFAAGGDSFAVAFATASAAVAAGVAVQVELGGGDDLGIPRTNPSTARPLPRRGRSCPGRTDRHLRCTRTRRPHGPARDRRLCPVHTRRRLNRRTATPMRSPPPGGWFRAAPGRFSCPRIAHERAAIGRRETTPVGWRTR